MSRLLTIIGATGTQGSSVVNAALQDPEHWRIRAITRDPASTPAKSLIAKGVEVVKADVGDAKSLTSAFADSYAIFAVTDFFGPFAASGADIEKAMEIEWTQTKNILEAAMACNSLQHFVWSTLPHAARISAGKHRIPHFEAKNRAEDFIRAHPELLAKTTFALVGWYATNFLYPIFKPSFLEPAGTHVQLSPVPADVPLHSIASPQSNIGKFVLAILNQPEKTLPGGYVNVAVELTSMGNLLNDWSKATGNSAVYVQTTVEHYDALWPNWGKVEGMMLSFFDEMRGKPWQVDGEAMLTAEDLGLDIADMISSVEAIRGLQEQ